MTDSYGAQVRAQLAEAQARIAAVRAQIAYRIRAELVCCDIYGRVNDGFSYEQREVNFKAHSAEIRRHDLCYWGEASARLAEDRDDSEGPAALPCKDRPGFCRTCRTIHAADGPIRGCFTDGLAGQHPPVAAQAVVDRIQVAWAAADDAAARMAALSVDEARMKAVVDGERRPSSLDLALIAQACEVGVDWLLYGD